MLPSEWERHQPDLIKIASFYDRLEAQQSRAGGFFGRVEGYLSRGEGYLKWDEDREVRRCR